MAAVVLFAGSGEGDPLGGAPAQQVVVDELTAVVRVDAQQRERQPGLDLHQRTNTCRAALLRTLWTSVQPVAMSVTVSEEAKSPLLSPPS